MKTRLLIAEANSTNEHTYSDAALYSMAGQLPSKFVFERETFPGEDNSLTLARGVVTAAEYVGGKVYVEIEWLSGVEPPSGFYVTPTGRGKMAKGVIDQYTPDHLTISDTSAFVNAERIP